MNFGAIDIGSNAIRLLIGQVEDGPAGQTVKKVNFIRLPIRLGSDVFKKGKISRNKKRKLAEALTSYAKIMSVYDVVAYRACATSAMRDASNGAEIVAYVEGMSGIRIDVIDGSEEAELIFSTHFTQHLEKSQDYLYIDVGGGSTEITLIRNGVPVKSKSFNVGTVRLMNDLVKDHVWEDLYSWVDVLKAKGNELIAIGTGGNINKIIKMTANNDKKEITLEKLGEFKQFLESFSYDERVVKLGLRRDRADVIIPAARIYSTILKRAGVEKMLVPKIGLADGIICQLHNQL